MARDYKSRAQRRARQKPSRPWVWFLVGFLAGAFSVGLAWLKIPYPSDQGANWIGARPQAANQEESLPVVESDNEEDEGVAAPRFDFYTLLPEMEVVVPDGELEPEPQRVTKAPPRQEPAKVGPSYLLQVGSFSKAADAERLKAQLALLGFEARVNRVKSDTGANWNRVRVGPFRSTTSLREAQDRLASNGMKTLVIKYKK